MNNEKLNYRELGDQIGKNPKPIKESPFKKKESEEETQ